MPCKDVIRSYQSNCVYHIYNRGVEKRTIFLDDQDYQKFLYYLHVYAWPRAQVEAMYPYISERLLNNNLYGEVEVFAYCLMPNHFHILIRIISGDAAIRLMKQVTNAYTKYFNEKYGRVGSLMQGPYKARRVEGDASLLQASRYIHRNALDAGLVDHPLEYRWSSLSQYISPSPTNLCYTSPILQQFASPKQYYNFVYLNPVNINPTQ